MSPLVALKEVTPGPTKERPRSGRVGHMTEQLTPVYPERFLRRACQNGALVSPLISPLRLSTADSQPSTFCPNSFRFTHFRKNASATPLVSHTFKTKDLKPFRFTYFRKKGRGSPHPATIVIPSEPAIFAGDEGSQRLNSREVQPADHKSPVYPEARRVTNHQSLRLSRLTSTLTKNASVSPLTSTLTKKGVGVPHTRAD